MNYQTFQDYYTFQKEKQISIGCRLTDAHIYPNNFQMMNVRLAAQLFSNRNAFGIKLYQEMPAKTPAELWKKSHFAGACKLQLI